MISSAVNGLPSCQLTPRFSRQVTDLPSFATAPFSRLGISCAEYRNQLAIGIVRRQRLIEDPGGVLVLGLDRKVWIEQRRPLPPQCAQRSAAAPLGRRERRRLCRTDPTGREHLPDQRRREAESQATDLSNTPRRDSSPRLHAPR